MATAFISVWGEGFARLSRLWSRRAVKLFTVLQAQMQEESLTPYSICTYIRIYSICNCDIPGWYACMHACEHTVVQWYDDESNCSIYNSYHMHYIAIILHIIIG